MTDSPQPEAQAEQQTEQTLQQRVAEHLEKIRPAVQMDGGDIRLVGVDENGVVSVELQGACVGCPSSTMTLKMGIERYLRDRIPEVTEVVSA